MESILRVTEEEIHRQINPHKMAGAVLTELRIICEEAVENAEKAGHSTVQKDDLSQTLETHGMYVCSSPKTRTKKNKLRAKGGDMVTGYCDNEPSQCGMMTMSTSSCSVSSGGGGGKRTSSSGFIEAPVLRQFGGRLPWSQDSHALLRLTIHFLIKRTTQESLRQANKKNPQET